MSVFFFVFFCSIFSKIFFLLKCSKPSIFRNLLKNQLFVVPSPLHLCGNCPAFTAASLAIFYFVSNDIFSAYLILWKVSFDILNLPSDFGLIFPPSVKIIPGQCYFSTRLILKSGFSSQHLCVYLWLTSIYFIFLQLMTSIFFHAFLYDIVYKCLTNFFLCLPSTHCHLHILCSLSPIFNLHCVLFLLLQTMHFVFLQLTVLLFYFFPNLPCLGVPAVSFLFYVYNQHITICISYADKILTISSKSWPVFLFPLRIAVLY